MAVNKENISATVDKATASNTRELGKLKDTVYYKRSFSQLVDLVMQKGLSVINKEIKKAK